MNGRLIYVIHNQNHNSYKAWRGIMLPGPFKISAVIYCKMLLNVRCWKCDRWCHLVNKEFCGTAPFTVHAFTMFTGWTVRNSTKISGNFFLLPIKNPITIYLGHVHVKWILILPLKSLVKQVYMQSKLGESTASYLIIAVKCKMLLNVRCC